MDSPNYLPLLQSLLKARSSDDVRNILTDIGDYADIGLDKPFGDLGLCWHAFGGKLSNFSSIGLGTKPGRSLTERLTNAIDAILEDRVPSKVSLPRSAREAARQWFGRPVSGPSDGLFKWSYSDNNYDRQISLALIDSGKDSAPTVDVLDHGIGIPPAHFPSTILSLQEGNKIQKWYLIGAFGQGGASTLSFCDYALIISRHKDSPEIAGFTVIRVLRLDEGYKEDTYAYMSMTDEKGLVTVPSCNVGQGSLPIYEQNERVKLPNFDKGTLVRHFTYKLTNLDKRFGPGPGNLYHYLHSSIFDPLLPFRIIDLRDPGKVREEIVTGSRNRLLKLERTATGVGDEEESGSVLRHYRQMEYVVPFGSEDPSVGVEYWVVLNYRKGTGAKKDELVLRSHSNELYIQKGCPIVGTLNGQNQGELSAQILRDLNLGMVSRHLIIHVDATKADSRVRRELFSTNREGFKEGPVLEGIISVLKKMLADDGELYAIERELTEKLAKREAQSTSEEVKKHVTRLLLEAGLQLQDEGTVLGKGDGEKQPVQRPRRPGPRDLEPLPTLPYPQVTKFKIVVPATKMSIHLNDNELVLVETDADSEFDRQGRLAIRTEPNCLEMASKSQLRGGRIRWRLRPQQAAKVGDTGKIIASITKPDGTQINSSVDFEILATLEEKAKQVKGVIPPFEIIAVDPYDDLQDWLTAWPDLTEDTPIEQLAAVAYKPVRAGGGIYVYYSTIFTPFKTQVDKLKSDSPILSELFRTNYEVWIGYHAILQENSKTSGKLDIAEETIAQLLEEDRVRVAQMQVKQALYTAELAHRSSRESVFP
jgi:hypothetical protein